MNTSQAITTLRDNTRIRREISRDATQFTTLTRQDVCRFIERLTNSLKQVETVYNWCVETDSPVLESATSALFATDDFVARLEAKVKVPAKT